MNTQKLEKIKQILKEEYRDKLSESAIDDFAKKLYYPLFGEQYELEYIPATIFEYESEEDIEGGDWCYIFGRLINLLDNGEATAKRLYNSFMHEYDLPDTFLKLINENAGYLSAEQSEKAKRKALKLFGRDIFGD